MMPFADISSTASNTELFFAIGFWLVFFVILVLRKWLKYKRIPSEQRYKIRIEELRSKGEVDGLIKALGHKNEQIRIEACQALRWLGDSRALLPLVNVLEDKDILVRSSAAIALGALTKNGDVSKEDKYVIIESLKKAFNSEYHHPECVRFDLLMYLSQSLENIGWKPQSDEIGIFYCILRGKVDTVVEMDKQTVDVLLTFLTREKIRTMLSNHEADKFITNVTKSLGLIGDSKAVEPLIAASKDEKGNMREAAIKALGEIAIRGDRRAMEFLASVLREERDVGLLKSAAESLDRLDWQPDTNESGAMYWGLKGQWYRCIELGEPAAKPVLLLHPKKGIVEKCYKNLKEIESLKARDFLQQYIELLYKELEETEEKVEREEQQCSKSMYPDYFSRDMYQKLIDEDIKPRISWAINEFKK